ncbi:DUF6216 family protein [Luteimonas terrae]|uniref:DUF3592 domain-containing protein n=1 Tax=Luteimonas terrae TaxID=1530191 RepID=A0ABU1XWY1_9GAMM|nr:DUF6216 family protein [Luteimonas terrae]MDR7193272.1 hypothetical protein [Luteimonas terrae]
MDWLNFLTREIAAGSLIGLFVACAYACWRAGSFHPINVRILRFFFSKDEVQDLEIKKSLADESALVSFRVTYGVRAETITDARRVIFFSNLRNIPLSLIGRSGWAFDIKSLSINEKRVPHKFWLAAPAIFLIILYAAGSLAAGISVSESLLVSLKDTGKAIWLTKEDARPAFNFFDKTKILDKTACPPGPSDESVESGFTAIEIPILCEIWNDPAIEDHLRNELSKQKRISLAALAVIFIYAFIALGIIREWSAQIELARRIAASTSEEEDASTGTS